MTYTYFVQYHINRDGGWGQGNTDFTTKSKITKLSQIRTMEKQLTEINKSSGTVIQNWILLKRNK